MKQYAILVAAIGLFAGCAHNGTGSSARYESGAFGITPLDTPGTSRVRVDAENISDQSRHERGEVVRSETKDRVNASETPRAQGAPAPVESGRGDMPENETEQP